MLRLATPFLVLLGAILIALAFDRPAPRADVVVAQLSDCFTLDPQRMSYQQDLRVARSLYEPLVRNDNRTGETIPGVAERWSLDDAGTTWTFELRDDARWSNGEPVTAEDFRSAWLRAILPDTAADYSGFFLGIEGARAFFDWRLEATRAFATGEERGRDAAEALWEETLARFDALVRIDAPDERTLVVRLAQPIPYFLDLCSFAVFAPVHRAQVASFATVDPQTGVLRQDHGWTKGGVLISNGPYRLERWRYKRDLRLVPNEHYWNPSMRRNDSVEIRCIEDPNTSTLAFEAGSVDWVTDVLVEYRADMALQQDEYVERHRATIDAVAAETGDFDAGLAAAPPPERGERRDLHVCDAFGTFFWSFNCRPTLADGEPNPFVEPAVRRAFTLATDRRTIIDRVLRTGESIARSITPAGSVPGYQPPDGLPYDVDRAREEFAAAGWVDRDGDGRVEDADGRPFPIVDLLYSTGNPRLRDMGLAMRDMWQRALGVEVELRGKDSKAYKEDLKTGEFMIARGGWYGDYGDPTTFLDICRTGDGNNDRRLSDPTFDALLDRAAAERDPAARLAILADAERHLLEEVPALIPMYHYATTYLFDPARLRGITRHPRLEQNLYQLEPIARGASDG